MIRKIFRWNLGRARLSHWRSPCSGSKRRPSGWDDFGNSPPTHALYGDVGWTCPAASATDIFCINASSTKTITVRRVVIGGTAGTAITTPFLLYRRVSQDTGGTAATSLALPVAVPHISSDSAATATLTAYTANPTVVDSSPSLMGALLVDLPVTTAAGGRVDVERIFGTGNDMFSKGLTFSKVRTSSCVLTSMASASRLAFLQSPWNGRRTDMARWKLMTPHYLNVEGESWEYTENDRQTGRPKRVQFPVPRLLDIRDPSCWTNRWGNKDNEDGEIIVCHSGKGEKTISSSLAIRRRTCSRLMTRPRPSLRPLRRNGGRSLRTWPAIILSR